MARADQDGAVAGTITEDIETILRVENAALQRQSRADRISDAIASFAGTMGFVLLHLAWFGAWVAVNIGAIPRAPVFDPYPFSFLCMIVALESVLLTTFVLVKQNRMGYLSDRRAHLALQVTLLTEREVTRLLQVTERLAERLDVEHQSLPSPELSRRTEVESLAQELDRKLEQEG